MPKEKIINKDKYELKEQLHSNHVVTQKLLQVPTTSYPLESMEFLPVTKNNLIITLMNVSCTVYHDRFNTNYQETNFNTMFDILKML